MKLGDRRIAELVVVVSGSWLVVAKERVELEVGL